MWCRSLAYRNVQKALRQHLSDTNQKIPVELEVLPRNDPISDDMPEPDDLVGSLIKEEIDPEEELFMDVIADPAVRQPDVETADRDMVSTMRTFLRTWPKMEREIMEMYFFEGFRIEDIAATLGCNLKTVKQMLKRARAKLRSRFADIVDTDAKRELSNTDRESFANHLTGIERTLMRGVVREGNNEK